MPVVDDDDDDDDSDEEEPCDRAESPISLASALAVCTVAATATGIGAEDAIAISVIVDTERVSRTRVRSIMNLVIRVSRLSWRHLPDSEFDIMSQSW